MPRDRDEWLFRLKAIEREVLVMKLAAIRLGEQAQGDWAILSNGGIASRDLDTAQRNLEGTYFVRLCAEFEMGLREYWATVRVSHPRTRNLVDALAAHRGIPRPLIASPHGVRDYRDSLVHQRAREPDVISFAIARSLLCRFASRLPAPWS